MKVVCEKHRKKHSNYAGNIFLWVWYFFWFCFWAFFLLRYFDVIYGCLFFRDCSRQWGVTNQAALRKANGNFCRALLIAVKAPRQIQYRLGYIYVSMQISSYICVKWKREKGSGKKREARRRSESESESLKPCKLRQQVQSAAAFCPLSARNFSLIIIVHQDAAPLPYPLHPLPFPSTACVYNQSAAARR